MMKTVSPDETTDTVSEDENEELEKFLAYIHYAYPFFGFGLWSVVRKDTPMQTEEAVIGRCGLQGIADEQTPDGRIELGYLIDENSRGQGYAYEACSAIMEYAFRELEIPRLYVSISEGNIASASLAKKLGFRPIENFRNLKDQNIKDQNAKDQDAKDQNANDQNAGDARHAEHRSSACGLWILENPLDKDEEIQ